MQSPRHTVVVGALARRENGDLLLVRHHRRGWEIPQGRVEEGEDLLAATRREVLEETGIEIEVGPLAAIHSKLSSPPALIFSFLAEYHAGKARPCEECPEVAWVPPKEAPRLVGHPVNLDRLRVLLEFDGRIVYSSYRTRPFAIETRAPLA